MRPKNLEGFVGQSHILAGGGLIRRAIEEDKPFSMIFWGPPGCGKTSLAMIIARETDAYFVSFSAVLSGVKEIRAVICEATKQRNLYQRRSILFVDEIHRFNKAQQDAFLHHVESGLITLIGATTENPSFEVIPPLLSRTRVILLHPFTDQELILILEYAIRDTENGLGRLSLSIHKDVIAYIAMTADGDARTALNNLQLIVDVVEPGSSNIRQIDLKTAEKALFKKALRYDKNGEEHYNLISALHKSLRGSDPDAALYWMQRMLAAGEDPLYVARRMVRFASEDIGIADPQALVIALAAMEAFRFLGPPEGELALAQAAAYLATAPKSNAIYTAHKKIKETIKKTGYLPVPLHIRNAPTKLTKEIGYGKGYKYAHDFRDAYAAQAYLPEALGDRVFFRPTERGFEKTVKKRLEDWKKRACHDPDREPEQAL
ncbi:MAG: replication-associated recombination protein A [Deltaproteobacteria bacterium]|jgi:putative ATPase|nr:replication-associated recombination protein A [Deltaproteobacteria bacterium]